MLTEEQAAILYDKFKEPSSPLMIGVEDIDCQAIKLSKHGALPCIRKLSGVAKQFALPASRFAPYYEPDGSLKILMVMYDAEQSNFLRNTFTNTISLVSCAPEQEGNLLTYFSNLPNESYLFLVDFPYGMDTAEVVYHCRPNKEFSLHKFRQLNLFCAIIVKALEERITLN